jgi:predicted hotdog family 3-hydroxylacyl-ACP dehydratase
MPPSNNTFKQFLTSEKPSPRDDRMDIEKLIPHRGRMKLINEVLDINADKIITSALVSDKWPLYQEGFVDPIVLIEIVAQTAAAHIRWKKGVDKGGGGGWLVGIKSADFSLDRIPLHTELITSVKPISSAENYSVLEGTVMAGKDTLGRIQIQVFRSEE